MNKGQKTALGIGAAVLVVTGVVLLASNVGAEPAPPSGINWIPITVTWD